MAKRLGDNPLFQETTGTGFDAAKERQALGIPDPEEGKKRGRPKNEELVRDNPAQEGLTADWTPGDLHCTNRGFRQIEGLRLYGAPDLEGSRRQGPYVLPER